MTAVAGVVVAVAGLLGLIFGSFLNVVIWRVPRGLSVVSPPSACPGCAMELRATDNVPVVSWVALGGRCRNCRMSISVRYPIVELITGFLFAVIAAWVSPTMITATTFASTLAAVVTLTALLVLAACSIALAAIDVELHRLPNQIVLFLTVAGAMLLGIAGLLTGDLSALMRAAIGGAVAFVVFFLVALIKPGGMGFGDVKLAGALGIYLGYVGWGSLIIGFFAAFLLGGVVGIILILAKRADRKGGIPFGPWMLAGAWIGIVAGEPLARQYMSFVGLA